MEVITFCRYDFLFRPFFYSFLSTVPGNNVLIGYMLLPLNINFRHRFSFASHSCGQKPLEAAVEARFYKFS